MAAADVENWDDEFGDFGDIQFRSASTATSIVSHPQNNHRDSTSSRLSVRSDSNHGDEHWDVLVDEQSSVKDALSIAKSKGIPLPSNLPRSALEGGTIRRLGGKAVKRAIADDWSEDLDFAGAPGQLRLAKAEDRDLSENLRQISAAFRSSPKSPDERPLIDSLKSPKARLAPTPVSLDSFKDGDEDDDFGDVPTIRVAKHRSLRKMFTIPSSDQVAAMKPSAVDGLEDDLEIPQDGQLRLSTKKMTPTTPNQQDDFDIEWAEGSLGTRNAGAKRSGMSAHSSNFSALSPTVSSTFTAESDEVMDGLVLPQGPVNFKDMLTKRRESGKENLAPQSISSPVPAKSTKTTQEENWAEDFVIPSGRVFDGARLTLHRNVKQKPQRATSPNKIKATTLTFNSKTTPQTTHSNSTPTVRTRFGLGHERQERPRSHLEPVSETGAPILKYQRPNSRLGHGPSSSVSSIPAPATPTPSTPSRRDARSSNPRADMRYQPATTTNAQLLRAKRSLPAISGLNSPTRSSFARPPSRQDGTSSRLRPRSPDRPESRLSAEKRGSAPFLPAGASASQSAHVSTRPLPRSFRRTDSDGSIDTMTAAQRSLSRLAARPQTPGKSKADYNAADLVAQAKKTMNKPLRRRNWGDGSELEIFDDLPTSAAAEARYTKQPIGRGAPRSIRNKLGQQGPATTSSTSLVSASARSGAETPIPGPSIPLSPPRFSNLPTYHPRSNQPSYLRDTAASRNARAERSISSTFHNMRGEPLAPVSSQIKATILPRPAQGSLRRKRSVQQKPHLIKPLGGDLDRAKEEKGMVYDPEQRLWLGNNDALDPFDVPDFVPAPSPSEGRHPSVKLGGPSATPNGGKSNMALIMNVGGSSGVQLVNGMVFDPRQMKWLKVAHGERGESIRSGTGSVQLEEEEDVFAGLEDLKEESERMSSAHEHRDRSRSVSGAHDQPGSDPFVAEDDEGNHASGHSGDEWGVAEEYDVGPEFIRRQKSEEERWKRKVDKWLRSEEEIEAEEDEGLDDWRWAIRDMVSAQDREIEYDQGLLPLIG